MLQIGFSRSELGIIIEALQGYTEDETVPAKKKSAENLGVRLANIWVNDAVRNRAPVEPAKKVTGACAAQVERNTKVLEMLLEKLSFFDIGFARDEMKGILIGDSVSSAEKESDQ